MEISAKELKERMISHQVLNILDVRERIEFATFNIGGINLPMSKFHENQHLLTWGKEEEIVLICLHGIRSKNAQNKLKELGYQNLLNLKGGLAAFQRIA